jgi:hypothetical protein
MSFEVSDLHYERMRSVRDSLNDNLGPNDSHVGNLRSSSDPELHSFGAVGGEFKRLFIMMINRLGGNSFGVAAVMNFSEGKAAKMLKIEGFLEILLMKFGGTVSGKSFSVEHVLDVGFDGETEVVGDKSVESIREFVSIFFVCRNGIIFENGEHLPGCMVALNFSGLVFSIGVVEDGLMFFDNVVDFLNVVVMGSEDDGLDFSGTDAAGLEEGSPLGLGEVDAKVIEAVHCWAGKLKSIWM